MRTVIMFCLIFSTFLMADNWLPKVTRDPSGRKLGDYYDYIKANPVTTFHSSTVYSDKADSSPNDVLVIVEERIYTPLIAVLDLYKNDLKQEGYTVTIMTAQGGTPEELKQTIIDKDPGVVLMVGNLPVAWFEMDEFFDGKAAYTNFPIDLFFMDTNGDWIDADSNGMYDEHNGALEADIAFGRVAAHNMTLPWEGEQHVTETEIIGNWFNKVHAFRRGYSSYITHSLDWIDDDWQYWGEEWSGNVGLAYQKRTTVYDTTLTVKTDYVNRIRKSTNNRYEHLLFCCHSGPNAHAITYRGGYQWLYNHELKDIIPQVGFYNLFCCSIARYTESDYIAGWYALQKSFGLLSVGSTKTGAMLQFQDFYEPLGKGQTYGESFKIWAQKNMETGAGSQSDSRSWFYGMTIIGDPTLKMGDNFVGMKKRIHSMKLPVKPDLTVYPNPARTEAVFKFKLDKAGITEIRIYDLSGRLVHSESSKVDKPGMQNRIWKINAQPGRYQVVVKVNNKILDTRGFVVIK